MKKNVIAMSSVLVSFALLAAFLTGCQSTKSDLRQNSPMVLVSVYSNSHLPWYDKDAQTDDDEDDSGDGLLNNAVSGMLSKNDPEYMTLQDRVDTACADLISALKDSGIDVVDNEKAQAVPSMKSGASWLSFMETKTPATGYKKISVQGSKKIKDILRETGGKSVAYVYFKFQKEKYNTGMFDLAARARCVMSIYVYDENGHKLVQKEYTGYSYDSVSYKNGAYDKQALCDYVQEAADSCINQFVYDYAGSFAALDVAEENGSEAASITGTGTPLAVPGQLNAAE